MRVVRAITIVMVLSLVGAACGDDGETEAGTDEVATDGGAADGADDATDTGTDDAGTDDSDTGDLDLDDLDLDDVDVSDLSRFENCADVEAAIDAAQSSAAADPTQATDPAQLEADLTESLNTIEALRGELPADLQDDADVMYDVISAIDEAFASIDYDVTSLDPGAMVEFAQSMLTADTMGMLEASANITSWVTDGCPG